LGKQQVAQLTFFEYVLGITIGSIAGTLSVDLSSRAWPHWVGLSVWSLTVFLLQWLSSKYRSISQYLVGEPTLIIMDGKILEEAMKKIRYTIPDLLQQLRDKGVFDLNQVAFAVLETDGKLSVLFKPEYLPVSPRDLGLQASSTGLSTPIIYNGVIIDNNLNKTGFDKSWLHEQLKQRGISSHKEVFLMTRDDAGSIYVDSFADHIYQKHETE